MKAIRAGYTRHSWIAFVLDVVFVLVFAERGRASHHLGTGILEILQTGLPFLIALVVGWVFVAIAGRGRILQLVPTRAWMAGVFIWLMTAFGGIGIRLMTGDTAAWPFVLVASALLAVMLLVPRLLLHSDAAYRELRGVPRDESASAA